MQARSEFLWGWAFILPTILGLLILNIFPMINTIWQSFHKTGDFGIGNTFVGLANYQKVFSNPETWHSLWNTIKYVVLQAPISIFLGLCLAVILNKDIPGRSIVRTVVFIPMVTVPAVIAMVWRWLYNSRFGLINNIFGLDINWISNPHIALYSIIIIGIWSDIGYNMIIFLAGLQEIPKDYYEASTIDGVGPVNQFFHITIPLISPTIFFASVTRIIAGLQVFDLIYMIMEETNPALETTQSLVYLFYKYSFIQKNFGYGSAIVVMLLVIILFITVLQLIAQKKWVHYE